MVCEIFEMWDVETVEHFDCGMFGKWNVLGLGCLGFGILVR